MKTGSTDLETSVEFAIDNALERMFILNGRDYSALVSEYKEWLYHKNKIEILVLEHNRIKD